ncbi:hypothetical protein J437_LFUL004318 [Ladona fulva]|uniref:Chitin-binding type-2 domain-containing protein n=1 Tax=Ladona fulva TaxID=123851 RepID=A0A8K0K963_LADFU|nr:hypothetical protein J437_LFUL004318 [Ladona fulva]
MNERMKNRSLGIGRADAWRWIIKVIEFPHFLTKELGVCDYPYRVDCVNPPAPETPPEEGGEESSPETPAEEQPAAPPSEETGDATRGLPPSFLKAGSPCWHNNVYPLNNACSRVSICRSGFTAILACPNGMAYDKYKLRCLPYYRVRCKFQKMAVIFLAGSLLAFLSFLLFLFLEMHFQMDLIARFASMNVKAGTSIIESAANWVREMTGKHSLCDYPFTVNKILGFLQFTKIPANFVAYIQALIEGEILRARKYKQSP